MESVTLYNLNNLTRVQLIQFNRDALAMDVNVLNTFSDTVLKLQAYVFLIRPRVIRELNRIDVNLLQTYLVRPHPDLAQYVNLDPLSKAGASTILTKINNNMSDGKLDPSQEYLFLSLADFLFTQEVNPYANGNIVKAGFMVKFIEADQEAPQLYNVVAMREQNYPYLLSFFYRYTILLRRENTLRGLLKIYPLNSVPGLRDLILSYFNFDQLVGLLSYSNINGVIYDYFIDNQANDVFVGLITIKIDSIRISEISDKIKFLNRIRANIEQLLQVLRQHDDSEVTKEYIKHFYGKDNFLNHLESFEVPHRESQSPIYQVESYPRMSFPGFGMM